MGACVSRNMKKQIRMSKYHENMIEVPGVQNVQNKGISSQNSHDDGELMNSKKSSEIIIVIQNQEENQNVSIHFQEDEITKIYPKICTTEGLKQQIEKSSRQNSIDRTTVRTQSQQMSKYYKIPNKIPNKLSEIEEQSSRFEHSQLVSSAIVSPMKASGHKQTRTTNNTIKQNNKNSGLKVSQIPKQEQKVHLEDNSADFLPQQSLNYNISVRISEL